ncbi:serine hydrolase [Streptosporangiaceae bacterium NEAU-GS5]|nr:serine hydrolase [Streptosporangiaceae bacterium NEAU-GS5]
MRVMEGQALAACLAVLLASGCGPSPDQGAVGARPGPAGGQTAAKPSPSASPSPCVKAYRDDAAAARAKKALTAGLKRLVAKRPGRVEIMAKDLASGAVVGYHEDGAEQITASGAKVDIAVTLLRKVRAGHHKLSGWERETLEQMIEHSDNKAADALYARIGGAEAVSATYAALRMTHTHPGPSHYWGGTTTSPSDRVRLMTALVKGSKAVHPNDRAYVLKLMELVEPGQKWGVSAAARAGDRVSLKNGWTPRPFIHDTWAVTSYGWVHGRGRSYVISVQTDIQPGMESGVATIESAGKLIAAHMSDLNPVRYRSCVSPVAP